MSKSKNFLGYIIIIILAIFSAANYNVFVFPNSFAPAGIDGLCTMVQDLSGIDIGYLSLVVNIPLLIAARIFLNRDFAIRTTVYVIAFSVGDILLKRMGIANAAYYTESSIVLAPVAAGVVRGILYAITLKLNATSGGVDVIAALVKRKRPHLNLMNTIFSLNIFVAACSYFVYGFKIEPVICGIIYFFMTSAVSNNIRTSENETIKFEVVTNDAEDMCEKISSTLGLTATIVFAKGGYSGENKKMVICITPKSKAPFFERLAGSYSDAVIFKSIVNNSLTEI